MLKLKDIHNDIHILDKYTGQIHTHVDIYIYIYIHKDIHAPTLTHKPTHICLNINMYITIYI